MNATDKQITLITRLLGEKILTGTPFEGHTVAPAGLDKAAASKAIEALFALDRKPQAKIEPGFYVAADGTPVKVQSNKAGTGVYGLVFSGRSWDYAPGIAKHFAGMVPMTAEQAALAGLASGRCIACCKVLGGETLTAQVAAVIGYGEICAGHHGWAFPKGVAAQRDFLAATTISA